MVNNDSSNLAGTAVDFNLKNGADLQNNFDQTEISLDLDQVDCMYDELKRQHREEIEDLTCQMESELAAMRDQYELLLLDIIEKDNAKENL